MTTPNPEISKIITLSVAHLHPDTIAEIDDCGGDLPEGPSLALRAEGFLCNTYLGIEDALDMDFTTGRHLSLMNRFPDLVLLRAVGRGLGASWINFDQDGPILKDCLPSYQENGTMILPEDPAWNAALSATRRAPSGTWVASPSREILEMIEAGQMPRVGMEMGGMGVEP